MTAALHLVVPGRLDQRTGGYLYDARMVAGLRDQGREVVVHELAGRFPDADATATQALTDTLARLPAGATIVIDGLAMGGLPGPVTEAAARLRLIALVHHPLAEETGLSDEQRERFRALETAALAPVRGVIVTSGHTRDRLQEYGVPPDRVRVVEPGTARAAHASGPPAGHPQRLLCVGSVTPRKGQDVLISALSRLSNDPGWECVCAGSLERDPPFARTIQNQIDAAGLSARVHLVGELSAEALASAYDGASMLVLPSWYEGYGMALTEALSRGLPIVSTTGGAIPYTVPADAGELVAPGDKAALAAVLRRWLSEPGTLARHAAAARAHAVQLPEWSHQVQAFGRAIDALSHHV